MFAPPAYIEPISDNKQMELCISYEKKRNTDISDLYIHTDNFSFTKNKNILFLNKLLVEIDRQVLFKLPTQFYDLYTEIEKSKYIIELPVNWDDEGSLNYDKQTWTRTIDFLIDYSEWIYDNFNRILYTPKIYHGPKGGIDILWEESSFKMLIHVEKDTQNGFFYADNNKNQITEGQFQLDEIDFFLLPLPINI